MGFRKILRKWDKRSRSTTKELYLARQVEIQPVFNRQVRLQCPGLVHRQRALNESRRSLSQNSRTRSRHACSI